MSKPIEWDQGDSARPKPTQAAIGPRPSGGLSMPPPAGRTKEAQVAQDEDSLPKVTPTPMRDRIVTAIGAPFRVVTGGPIDLAVAHAVLWTMLFVLLVTVCTFSCTATYTVGHGWFGLFGCPREVLVVEPVSEPTRRELLKQGGE